MQRLGLNLAGKPPRGRTKSLRSLELESTRFFDVNRLRRVPATMERVILAQQGHGFCVKHGVCVYTAFV